MPQSKKKMMVRFEPQQSADVLDMFLYDVIEGGGYDWWTGEEIESETSQDFFRKELAKYPSVSQIRLFVNSRGGSVYEAMGIRAQLMRHSAKVTAYVDGWAASAASLILTGCDHVVMDSAAMQMLHNMWTFAAGNAKELREIADAMDKMMEGNRQAYLDKAGDLLSEDRLIEMMDKETWLTATECKGLGLCDEITKIQVQTQQPTPQQRVMQMRSLLEVVAAAEPFEEIQPAPPDVDKPPNPDDDPAEAEPEPAEPEEALEEPEQSEEGAAEMGGSFDFIAAIARAAERNIKNER